MRKLKILIVDDDLVSRKYLHGLLMEYGLCDIAANGKEAVDFFKASLENNAPYDMVFLDIMMPEMDGDETLEIIRKMEEEANIASGQGAKVAMISALTDKRNILSSFSKGCEYYLVKPVPRHKIKEIMLEIGSTEQE